MSDGQGKSDDLIAELAKLMASNANGVEAEAKPAPKLVSGSDVTRPAAPPIRIPGMDAPVAVSAPVVERPTAVPVAVPAVTAERPAAAAASPAPIKPGVLRIPGMDQPVSVGTAPAVALEPAQTTTPAKTGPVAAFGAPAPAVDKLPKFVPARPATPSAIQSAPAVEPSFGHAAADPQAPVAREPDPMPIEAAPAPRSEPTPAKVEPTLADEPTVEPEAKPAAGDFHFDFGFSTNPPAPIANPEAARQQAPAAQPAAAPVGDEAAPEPVDDPIAELIAAELEGARAEPAMPPAPEPVAPVVVQSPMPRPQPQPSAPRPVNPSPLQQQPRPTMPQAPVTRPMVAAQAAPKAPEPRPPVPAFGMAARPQPSPSVERDPMEEIESLIGEAVRVELSAPERPTAKVEPAQPSLPAQPAPSVPPLTAGIPPRRATIKESTVEVPSAEAAILAAAAATGAEVGRIDKGFVNESSPYKRPKAKPERRGLLQGGLRQYVGMAVAGTLLLAAGFGLYWVLGMGHSTTTEAPVLSADTTPAKQPPPAVPTPQATQGSVVFGELDGKTEAPAHEQLVSRDDSTDTSVADVAQPVGQDTGDTGATAAAGAGETELANRKVRTVTVRPDGTIVSGDDAVAGSEELPVDKPSVPAIPGADVQPSDLLAALPTNDAAKPATPAAAAPTDAIGALAAASETASTPDATASTAAAATGATINPTIVAPVPMARPRDRSVLGGGANQQVASTAAPLDLVPAAPAPTATAAAQAAAPQATARASVPQVTGPYVQLSSQPTEGDAQASLQSTQARLSSLLGGRSLAVRQVDLGAKGTWYRVVLPVDSFQEATQTCASLKANGTDCVAING